MHCWARIWDLHRAQLRQHVGDVPEVGDAPELRSKVRAAAAALRTGVKLLHAIVDEASRQAQLEDDILLGSRVLEHACALRLQLAESIGVLLEDADRPQSASSSPMAATAARSERRLQVNRLSREIDVPDLLLLRMLDTCAQGLGRPSHRVNWSGSLGNDRSSVTCRYWALLTHPAVQLYLGWWLVAPLVAADRPGCHGRGLPPRLVAGSPAWLWSAPRDDDALEPLLEVASLTFLHDALLARARNDSCGCTPAALRAAPAAPAPAAAAAAGDGPAVIERAAAADAEEVSAAVTAAASAAVAAAFAAADGPVPSQALGGSSAAEAAAPPPPQPLPPPPSPAADPEPTKLLYSPLQVYELLTSMEKCVADADDEAEHDEMRQLMKKIARPGRIHAVLAASMCLTRMSPAAAAERLEPLWRQLVRATAMPREHWWNRHFEELGDAAGRMLRLWQLRARPGQEQKGAAAVSPPEPPSRLAVDGSASASASTASTPSTPLTASSEGGLPPQDGQAVATGPDAPRAAAALLPSRRPPRQVPHRPPLTLACCLGQGFLPALEWELRWDFDYTMLLRLQEQVVVVDLALRRPGAWLGVLANGSELQVASLVATMAKATRRAEGVSPIFDDVCTKSVCHFMGDPRAVWRLQILALLEQMALIPEWGGGGGLAMPSVGPGQDPAARSVAGGAAQSKPGGKSSGPNGSGSNAVMSGGGGANGNGSGPSGSGAGTSGPPGNWCTGPPADLADRLRVNYGLCGFREVVPASGPDRTVTGATGDASRGGGASGSGRSGNCDGGEGGVERPGRSCAPLPDPVVLEPRWEDIVGCGGCPADGTWKREHLGRLVGFTAREWLSALLVGEDGAPRPLTNFLFHRSYRVVWHWLRLAAQTFLAAQVAVSKLEREAARGGGGADPEDDRSDAMSVAISEMDDAAAEWHDFLFCHVEVFGQLRQVLAHACAEMLAQRAAADGGGGGSVAGGRTAGGGREGGPPPGRGRHRARGGARARATGRAPPAAAADTDADRRLPPPAEGSAVTVGEAAMDVLPAALDVLEVLVYLMPGAIRKAIEDGWDVDPSPSLPPGGAGGRQRRGTAPAPAPTPPPPSVGGPGLPYGALVGALLERQGRTGLKDCLDEIASRPNPSDVEAARLPYVNAVLEELPDRDEFPLMLLSYDAYFERCHNKRCAMLRGESEATLRLKPCPLCRAVWYCNSKCREADWSTGGHERRCRQHRR